MKPGYRLAFELGIPVIIQPEWDECEKLWERGENLRAKGGKIQEEGRNLREKGAELWEEGWKLWDEGTRVREEGWNLYEEAVTRELGQESVKRINWNTGKVTKA